MTRKFIAIISFLLLSVTVYGGGDLYSVAGFWELEGSPRTVSSMNPAWKFFKGEVKGGASAIDFDDSTWEVVGLPATVEVVPLEASGGKNYQGVSWYRKKFTPSKAQFEDKRMVLYFEGIMGKSQIWVNGTKVEDFFGGFLPIAIDITDNVKLGEENLIAVKADNSDDPIYPPGKPQATLDFCYFGGIYRDAWLISTNKGAYLSDENMQEDGGVLVHYTDVSKNSATVNLSLNLANDLGVTNRGTVEVTLAGQTHKLRYAIPANGSKELTTSFKLKNPKLWSPETPHLYDLDFVVKNSAGEVVDGYKKRIGVRSIVLTADKGFILNGEVYPRKLIGANRHQDFAVVGNALSNSLHWRDAQKLKDAAMEIIRNAHYPQDPAFMDACDALGLFVIVNTPGWQFWNDAPIFQQRVYNDIRQMVRRDRNRPSVIMWEPILNESWYPEDFAKTAHDIVKQEFPYSPNYTASDLEARGNEHLDIKFTHPLTGGDSRQPSHTTTEGLITFTREFGDNVDNWNSHNSPSRVAIQWGEAAQLIQARGYIKPPYKYTSVETLYQAGPGHFGGTLWHSFDHQRGYHPDPFYGGIMTAMRRPKYSYYAFQAQGVWKEPMVYIANIMSPFSPQDVTVYSNCDEVRLYTHVGDTIRVYNRPEVNMLGGDGAPAPPIIFENAFDVMMDKALSRQKRIDDSYLLAEGYRDGKLVATHKVAPSRRPTKVNLLLDTMNIAPVADGGDLVVVVAQITDDHGVVKRLNNEWVKFSVEGEAEIVGDGEVSINPAPILWGEAAAILKTTPVAGEVKVVAQVLLPGIHTPVSDTITFTTQAPLRQMIYSDEVYESRAQARNQGAQAGAIDSQSRQDAQEALKEVEQQQEDFGEKR